MNVEKNILQGEDPGPCQNSDWCGSQAGEPPRWSSWAGVMTCQPPRTFRRPGVTGNRLSGGPIIKPVHRSDSPFVFQIRPKPGNSPLPGGEGTAKPGVRSWLCPPKPDAAILLGRRWCSVREMDGHKSQRPSEPSVHPFPGHHTRFAAAEGRRGPSPGPLRLLKAPAAGHPLPRGEGSASAACTNHLVSQHRSGREGECSGRKAVVRTADHPEWLES